MEVLGNDKRNFFKKQKPHNQKITRFQSWPTRTRTLNVGTKNRCVTNYTIGQCFYAGANLIYSFNLANIFLKILTLTKFCELFIVNSTLNQPFIKIYY